MALFVIYEDYNMQKKLSERPNAEFNAIWALLAMKAADKQYDQVDFDDPAQNILHYKRLTGHSVAWGVMDKLLAKFEGDPRKTEGVYTICRQAAKDIHLAIANAEGKETTEVAQRVVALLGRSLDELDKLIEPAGITK